ncbi:helix-turn-helix domain-containing protein [Dyella choica]|uniref:AraC family transcriptional regulator n=1 Tax=Dyella choica TaxID=1927959 RepID=A0A432M901_9GAMM|nr:helix-turn-helix domain-containing protein [Dyella choica]RUL78360.1 AraC family transcriptional regulator [Dyella choica]
MGFQRIVPAPPLASVIEAVWDWDMPAGTLRYERILPGPGAGLIINLLEDETRVYQDDESRHCLRASGSVIGGPYRHSWIIDTAEQVRVMGVNFRPGGVHALIGISAEELGVRDINLQDMFGANARRLRQRLLETVCPMQRLALLEQWLCKLCDEPTWDAVILHAAATLARVQEVPGIGRLQRESGYSAHRFGLLFRHHIGMTAKQYARLMRFRAVVAMAHPAAQPDWVRIAVDGGYCDQAHMSHEFRRFAGITPSEFAGSRGPYPNHVPV